MENEQFSKVNQDALETPGTAQEALNRQLKSNLTGDEEVIMRVCMCKEIFVMACLIFGIFNFIQPEKCDLVKHDLH